MEKKMKRKDKMAVHHSSVNHSFETDPSFFKAIQQKFGKFTLDAAATKKNALCKEFFTEETDALGMAWRPRKGGLWFCNPPYGRGLINWVSKASDEGSMYEGIMLIPARTDTQWFEMAANYGEVILLKGRQQFYFKGKPAKHWSKKFECYKVAKAPFPSALIHFGPDVDKGLITLGLGVGGW